VKRDVAAAAEPAPSRPFLVGLIEWATLAASAGPVWRKPPRPALDALFDPLCLWSQQVLPLVLPLALPLVLPLALPLPLPTSPLAFKLSLRRSALFPMAFFSPPRAGPPLPRVPAARRCLPIGVDVLASFEEGSRWKGLFAAAADATRLFLGVPSAAPPLAALPAFRLRRPQAAAASF
jgi:hypothetical protein